MAEKKKEEKIIKTTKNTLSEDFFIEMLRPLNVLEKSSQMGELRKIVLAHYSHEELIRKFTSKYKARKIPNITDFRLLTRLLKAGALTPSRRASLVLKILEDQKYEIRMAYDEYARAYYETSSVLRQCGILISTLTAISGKEVTKEQRVPLADILSELESIIERVLTSLRTTRSRCTVVH